MMQLLIATYTLWLHRGDQISRWGFASFSFVPVPYAIMSLVNGISHLSTPDYPALYMVSSTFMEEAEEAGGTFRGVVGHVEPGDSSDSDNGYGTGFDSDWKGLRPGIVLRTMVLFYNYMEGRKVHSQDLVVSERSHPGYEQSENRFSEFPMAGENTGSTSTACLTGSHVLLVIQCPLSTESATPSKLCTTPITPSKVPALRWPRYRFGTGGVIWWPITCSTLKRL